MASFSHRLGNRLYECCYPLYRPIYSAFKAVTDRAERRLLRRCVMEGMVVADAGANIGIYSEFLSSLVGPSGRVHSFEPSPENFSRLQRSVRRRSNIVCNPMAVGAKSGEILLHLSDTMNVDHRTYASPEENRRSITVRCIALDDYFPVCARVNLIKADIQGFELAALMGAERVLAENPNIKLLLEFWPYGLKTSGADPRALLEFLAVRNFSVAKVERDGALCVLTDDDFGLGETRFNFAYSPAPVMAAQ